MVDVAVAPDPVVSPVPGVIVTVGLDAYSPDPATAIESTAYDKSIATAAPDPVPASVIVTVGALVYPVPRSVIAYASIIPPV